MTSNAPHPARELPEPERIDYLTIVASVVLADHVADADEIAQITELCHEVGLSDAGREQVLESAKHPEPSVIDATLARLKAHIDLRVSLLTDAIVIAFADGKVAATESSVISRLADALDIESGQIGLIARYVESVILERDEQALSRELGKGIVAEHRAGPGLGPSAIRWLHRLFKRAS
jgi:uncharacterized tellurite resistance protein B-like protein